MNKKGEGWFMANLPWMILVLAVFILFLATNEGVSADWSVRQAFSDAMNVRSVSFGDAGIITDSGIGSFRFFDYVFGKIPGYLVDLTTGMSSAIITIGVWLILFMVFGEVIELFGMFSRVTSKTIGFVLTIIVANFQLIKAITIGLLALTAFAGALSVVLSLIIIFVLFAAFQLGFKGWRRKIILRKAEDEAMRGVAGGKVAASGIDVLKQITAAAGKKRK